MREADREKTNETTRHIIGAAYEVANSLGSGFLEKVYENALAHELREFGLRVEQQKSVHITYRGVLVGEYVADLCVEEMVVVELKAARALDDIHRAQCMNYLKATGLRICLLINFGRPKIEIQRIVRNF